MVVDYWLLGENTGNKKVPKYIEKFLDSIKDYPLENKTTIKTKHYRENLTNIGSDNDTHLLTILKKLNI